MSSTVISYPIPPYQNVPIHPEYFRPRAFVISNITRGVTTLVLTTTAMDYVIGQQVRLIIPSGFGCDQLNGLTGFVIAVLNSQVVQLSIDSSKNVQPFNLSAIATVQQPQILAIGDVNTGIVSHEVPYTPFVTIAGAFRNISPK